MSRASFAIPLRSSHVLSLLAHPADVTSRLPIALVYRNFNLAGSIERDFVLLARGLAARGLDVHCFGVPEHRSASADGVVHHDVPTILISRARFGYAVECASFALAATRELRRRRGHFAIVDVFGSDAWDQDVVTVHGVTRAEQARWPDRAGRAVPLARLRSALAPVTSPRQMHARIVERLQFRRGRTLRAIARSEQVRDDLQLVHGFPRDRIDVIPPAVDARRLAGPSTGWLRRELAIPPSAHLVLFASRLSEDKGLNDAIQALAGLDDAHLVVLGDGATGSFAAAARRARVDARVHFVGFSTTPERFFRETDVFLFPTWQDVWGMPVIEAMAAGVPVVCSDAAGAAAAVTQADAGLVVPVGVQSVHEALRTLLADPARRARLGENGSRAARNYDVDAYISAVLRSYARVVEEKASLSTSSDERLRLRSALAVLAEMQSA